MCVCVCVCVCVCRFVKKHLLNFIIIDASVYINQLLSIEHIKELNHNQKPPQNTHTQLVFLVQTINVLLCNCQFRVQITPTSVLCLLYLLRLLSCKS